MKTVRNAGVAGKSLPGSTRCGELGFRWLGRRGARSAPGRSRVRARLPLERRADDPAVTRFAVVVADGVDEGGFFACLAAEVIALPPSARCGAGSELGAPGAPVDAAAEGAFRRFASVLCRPNRVCHAPTIAWMRYDVNAPGAHRRTFNPVFDWSNAALNRAAWTPNPLHP